MLRRSFAISDISYMLKFYDFFGEIFFVPWGTKPFLRSNRGLKLAVTKNTNEVFLLATHSTYNVPIWSPYNVIFWCARKKKQTKKNRMTKKMGGMVIYTELRLSSSLPNCLMSYRHCPVWRCGCACWTRPSYEIDENLPNRFRLDFSHQLLDSRSP
mgnify:CR=1 FL=1